MIILKKIYWFTLIELIIVVTILAILAIISFISFQGFIAKSKDASKLATLKNIESWLNIFALKTWKFPALNQEEIYWTWIIDGIILHSYWKIWKNISSLIDLNGKITDPNNNSYFYWVSFNQRDYQIATFLENQLYAWNIFVQNVYAQENKNIHMIGNYDWLLIYNSGSSLKYIINLPSLIFSQTGTVDIIQNEPKFLYNSKQLWETKDELLKDITGKNVTLTGILLTYNQNQLSELSNKLGYEKQKIWEKIFWDKYIHSLNTKKLWIYYWYPSSLNNEINDYHLDKIIQDFNEYDSIVLWENIANPSHEDYQNIKTILHGTWADNLWYAPEWFSWYTWISYWYITLMNDFSDIATAIDNWKTLWVQGIFFDEAGYDFLIDEYNFEDKISARNHQNTAINYAHSKGLKVIMNSWDIDDVLWINSWESPSTLQSWDAYLLESFVYNPHAVATQYYDYDNQLVKINKATQYKNTLWIELYCVGLLPNSSEITPERVKTFYDKSNWICDYIQITEESFWTWNSPTLTNYLKEYK